MRYVLAAFVYLSVVVFLAPDVSARRPRVVEVPNTKPISGELWTVQSVAEAPGAGAKVTIKGKDEVKQLNVSATTDVVIDGTSAKPADIKVGMKCSGFVMGGQSLPLSRIVLQSVADPGKK